MPGCGLSNIELYVEMLLKVPDSSMHQRLTLVSVFFCSYQYGSYSLHSLIVYDWNKFTGHGVNINCKAYAILWCTSDSPVWPSGILMKTFVCARPKLVQFKCKTENFGPSANISFNWGNCSIDIVWDETCYITHHWLSGCCLQSTQNSHAQLRNWILIFVAFEFVCEIEITSGIDCRTVTTKWSANRFDEWFLVIVSSSFVPSEFLRVQLRSSSSEI